MRAAKRVDHVLDDRRELQLRIGGIGKTCHVRGAILRLVAPFGQPLRGRAVEEQCVAEQPADGFLDLGAQRIGNGAHLADARGAALDPFEIVADRLFARNVRDRAEDRREEAGQPLAARVAFARLVHAARQIGLGVDIDEAPVDLAMRGPVALAQNALLPLAVSGQSYGLHPRLSNLQRLFGQGRAAAVFNVGTLVRPVTKAELSEAPLPRNLYSHSDQTQQWQTSDPMGGATGWGAA